MRADALFYLDRYARLRRADRRDFPDGAELKSTGRRQPARHETGALQEGSTIDRYWPDHRRQILKSCATGLAVPPLGQHRTLTCLVFDIRSRSEERRVGKECVIRVDPGGRRIIKKKKKNNKK